MPYIVAVLIAGVAVAGCSFGVRTVEYDEQPAQEAVGEFLDYLVKGDNDAAYELLTDESMSHTTRAEFIAARDEAEKKRRGIEEYELLTPVAPVQGVDPTEALSVPTRLTHQDGTTSDLALETRNENGQWKVHFPEE